MVYDEPVLPKSDGGGARSFFTDPKRPKMNVTLPASLSSFDHGREAIGAGRVGTMGLGIDGSGRGVRFARRRLDDDVDVDAGVVGRGIALSEDMTSSAKSSNPGRELITLIVVTGCGLCFSGGMGKDRIVRDEHGGKENVPDVHDASGGDASGGGAAFCSAATTSGFAGVAESSVDFPDEDVDAGIAEDDEPEDDDEAASDDDEVCEALALAQANRLGAGV